MTIPFSYPFTCLFKEAPMDNKGGNKKESDAHGGEGKAGEPLGQLPSKAHFGSLELEFGGP